MKYLLLLVVVVAVVLAALWLTRQPSEPIAEVVPSYSGRPEDHTGNKTLLVAVHAKWASVWRATAEVLAEIDREQYDIMLIDAGTDRDAVKELDVDIIPTVIVYQNGKETARLPNMMNADDLP